MTSSADTYRAFGACRYLSTAIISAAILTGAPRVASGQSYEIIHSFTATVQDPALPDASLIEASDGNLYGTAPVGGAGSIGAVFRITPSGAMELVSAFPTQDGRGFPHAALIQASDGNLYGVATSSTLYGLNGNLFRVTPGGVLSVPLPGSSPSGGFISSTAWTGLTRVSSGDFYLPTIQTRIVTIHKWALPNFTLSSYQLPATTGLQDPGAISPLIEASDGALYFTTSASGAAKAGMIAKMTPAGTFTVLHEFAGGAEGAAPRSIMQASDGNFYGVTESGGVNDLGTIFQMTPTGTVTVLHSFTGFDGANPISALIQGPDGSFFGTTPNGGDGQGVIFLMTSDHLVAVVHSFQGGLADGASPQSALLRASDGNLYGTTRLGGVGVGTVFRLTPSGEFSVIAAFGSHDDGANPWGRSSGLVTERFSERPLLVEP